MWRETETMQPVSWPPEPVRLLVLDVDGTLTDGGMYFTADGLAMKRFDVKDGLGLRLLQEAGIEVLLLSTDDSPVTAARARHLKIAQAELGCPDKGERVRGILTERGFAPGEVCYMGDDVTDLPAFAVVGHTAAPADAVAEVRAAAEYVTTALGGHGAVREVCDRLMAAKG